MRLPILDVAPPASAMWFSEIGPDLRVAIAADPNKWARIAGSAARYCRMYNGAVDTGNMRIVEIRAHETPNKWGDNVFCTVMYSPVGWCSALAGRYVDGRIIWTCYAD